MMLSDEEIDYICGDILRAKFDSTREYDRAIARAVMANIAAHEAKAEPFGYFRAEPMGWTDCAATDEGAIALYDCVDCEIVALQEQYRTAIRTVQRVRDRMRVLGKPMPGQTS